MEDRENVFVALTLYCIENKFLIQNNVGNTTVYIPEKLKEFVLHKFSKEFPDCKKEDLESIVNNFIANGQCEPS